jgi:hypothetical protein
MATMPKAITPLTTDMTHPLLTNELYFISGTLTLTPPSTFFFPPSSTMLYIISFVIYCSKAASNQVSKSSFSEIWFEGVKNISD